MKVLETQTPARRTLRWIQVWIACFAFSFPVYAANLSSETLKAWDDYVQAAQEHIRDRAKPGKTFLWADESPDRLARVKAGEIVVSAAAPNVPISIPSGLIHDWMGAAFVPNTTIEEIEPVVRDYARYKEFYRPAVTDSKLVALGDTEDRFSMQFVNKSFFRTNALESVYKSVQFRVDERHSYTLAQTTHIREIAQYGSAKQRFLPEDAGTGLIWRLFSVTRFEERDGGVYIELEAMALSRDIPASIHWLVEPIVRRVSRASLAKSLQQTRDAIAFGSGLANRTIANRR